MFHKTTPLYSLFPGLAEIPVFSKANGVMSFMWLIEQEASIETIPLVRSVTINTLLCIRLEPAFGGSGLQNSRLAP